MQTIQASKRGIVKVTLDRGVLRLQMPSKLSKAVYNVRQKYIPLGLHDTPDNRKLAEAKAQSIQSDIDFERFDPTLKKYGLEDDRYGILVQFPSTKTESKAKILLPDLWTQYVEVRKSSVSPSTMRSQYQDVRNKLKQCPYKTLEDSQKIIDWAISNFSPNATKRLITQLAALCHWGVKSKLVDYNPFNDRAKEIKVLKASNEDNDINPFSKEERNIIIEAFKTNRYYKRYALLVEFLFFTGCRPSEALALQWKHITNATITFEQAVVQGENGLTLKEGLKTQQKRRFPVNAQLLTILEEIESTALATNPDDLVFPSPDGKWIDFHNFRNRAWKTILEELNIPYRKPYQTRHTFVTQAILQGVNIPKLAQLVGNSPEIILRHYASVGSEITIPEL